MSASMSTTQELCDALGIQFSTEQLRAITAPLEPGVIIAGAGSGKTTVMAARVVWLVGTGLVSPQEVLGLTFTRKAAAELAHRISSALARAGVVGQAGTDEAGEQVVMTYDSFAARLVSEHGLRVGVETDPLMLTGASRYRLASRVVANAPGPFEHLSRLRPVSVTERVLKLDAELTSHLVTREQVIEHGRASELALDEAPLNNRRKTYAAIAAARAVCGERRELLDLVDGYQRLKKELGLVEFADQMAVAAHLVDRAPAVAESLRSRFRVVLLDEYQDTSSAQAQLLRALFSGADPEHGLGHAVTAVGDPFQAIYGWRGAAASNILQFAHDFPTLDGRPATAYSLTVNRRSGHRILQVANELARPLRNDPVLVRTGHEAILLTAPDEAVQGEVWGGTFEDWGTEVAWLGDQVVDEGRQHRTRQGEPDWARIAVLVRRNADIGAVYQALTSRDVPTEIVGLGGLLRLPEIADIVSTLTLLDDVTSNPDVVRLLTGPRWRIGPTDLALLGRRAVQLAREGVVRPDDDARDLAAELGQVVAGLDPAELVCLLDAVDSPGELPYSDQARERLARFSSELRELRTHAAEPITELLVRVVAALGLDVELSATTELAASNRKAQLAAFTDAVTGYVDVDGDASLGGLLAWLAAELEHGAGLDQATPTDRNSVKLLTVHRAKGLEWDVVFLPAMVLGTFPSDRVSDNWTKSPAVLPADLRGDADSIPQLQEFTNQALGEYAEELKAAQRRSEDRLAYVAVTRARHRLVASGHTWRSGLSRPRQPSPYLLAVLAEAEQQGHVVATAPPAGDQNPSSGAPSAVAWPTEPDLDAQSRRWTAAELVEQARARRAQGGDYDAGQNLTLDHEAMVHRWDAEIDQLLTEARQRTAARVEVPIPASVSASALMAAARDPQDFAMRLVRPMPRPVSRAASLGTRFHEWVERRFQMPTLLDPDDWPETDLTASDEQFARLVAAFEKGPFANRQPVAVEAPFVMVMPDGALVRGRIDAVYATPDDPEHDFQVVDWKTSSLPADPMQLSLYREAWAQAHGIDPARVDAVFLHVLTGWVERPEELPALDVLRVASME